jgi:hypothetical protein
LDSSLLSTVANGIAQQIDDFVEPNNPCLENDDFVGFPQKLSQLFQARIKRV